MAIDNSAWDGQAAMSAAANSDDPAAAFAKICAGKREGDPSLEKTWALPHHKNPGSPANAAGVRNAESRLPQTQGLTNADAAKAHLDAHMKEIQSEEKSAPAPETRAQAGIPGGQLRTHAFPTSDLRGHLVEKDGRARYHLHGFATTFEQGYEMWDRFGSYTETVGNAALDKSLALGPDVAFLVNHRGLVMARTISDQGKQTLYVKKGVREDGATGLEIDAYLNPDRSDVRDLISALDDKIVTEMSFAFLLNEGEWNEDMTEFRITEADINRGDVSAVNYGANPFTSIEARSADLLRDIDRMPAPVAKATIERAIQRLRDLGGIELDALKDIATWEIVDETDEEIPEHEPEKRERDQIVVPIGQTCGGKPIYVWRTRLEGLRQLRSHRPTSGGYGGRWLWSGPRRR